MRLQLDVVSFECQMNILGLSEKVLGLGSKFRYRSECIIANIFKLWCLFCDRKKKKLAFKLDASTAGTALRISASGSAVEYIGSARNNLQGGHIRIHPQAHNSSLQNPHPYPRISAARLRRSTFATVLSDTCISQVILGVCVTCIIRYMCYVWYVSVGRFAGW